MTSKNNAILLIGSNIDPAKNVERCLQIISNLTEVAEKSNLWKTEAVGSDGPDFYNFAVTILTYLDEEGIRNQIIQPIETRLHRVRTKNKFAPRTIDIDIIIFNGSIRDFDIWHKLYIALPISEIKPNLTIEKSGETLAERVNQLKSSARAELIENTLLEP